ncbi:MAG: isoprenyl transferase [Crocinitomicaceae bacterium]|nr:isoprenyl transferase [Crocinitomicaceae bacterium]
MSYFEQIDKEKLPSHVAIIMDGNGRWAKSHGQERIFGHFNGVEAVRASLKAATRAGIPYLTLYAFSTENWNRPKEEVEALMNLLVETIINEIDELDRNGVRLCAIGDTDQLPDACRTQLFRGIERTRSNAKVSLILALNYSARWEIVNAVKTIGRSGISEEKIDADLVSNSLTTRDFPDPELLIRTSGEHRVSNFLLWQIAYTELYFTDTLWPDFNEEEFYKAVVDFQHRERRFGKTSEQISPSAQTDKVR